ncbi:hypothetical protein COV94_00170 [Candidatus Woesearchaeota archaeon CG11_big_fil_rev_8_21_14_0_20_57_5]|nr:MAG: hypothetical protein COV94_00170 [Candidatus Woesearchaeota archaeon CG11_big_fil_rev_8_21_14_0_20_57_5]
MRPEHERAQGLPSADESLAPIRQSDMEVLLAQQFADALNTGEIAVEDCCDHLWGVALPDFYGCQRKVFHAGWLHVLLPARGLLDHEVADALASRLLADWQSGADRIFNPYLTSLQGAALVAPAPFGPLSRELVHAILGGPDWAARQPDFWMYHASRLADAGTTAMVAQNSGMIAGRIQRASQKYFPAGWVRCFPLLMASDLLSDDSSYRDVPGSIYHFLHSLPGADESTSPSGTSHRPPPEPRISLDLKVPVVDDTHTLFPPLPYPVSECLYGRALEEAEWSYRVLDHLMTGSKLPKGCPVPNPDRDLRLSMQGLWTFELICMRYAMRYPFGYTPGSGRDITMANIVSWRDFRE